jgi:hypothetical protein
VALLTLADGRAELDARGYSRFADARQNVWLNSAKNRFEDYPFDWPWLKATTTGAAPLTISDLRRVRSVVDTNARVSLEQIDADELIEFVDAVLTLSGAAAWWYLSAETVVSTYPTTAALSVRYVKFSPELSGDSDTPLIPARYRQTWLDLAEVEVLRYGVKDVAAAASLDASVQVRLGEIAGVYSMQGQPAFMESLMTGASTDG